MRNDAQEQTTRDLRTEFEQRLCEMPQVRLDTYKDTELVCIFFGEKEFAHFHGDNILDLRLTPKIIREEGLSRSVSARIHPNRSPNSRWICIEFSTRSDVDKLLHLVARACDEMA